MKKFQFKLLLIAPSLILTSCGYGLKEIFTGMTDISRVKRNH